VLHIANADETLGECLVEAIGTTNSTRYSADAQPYYNINNDKYREICLSGGHQDQNGILDSAIIAASDWIHALEQIETRVEKQLFNAESAQHDLPDKKDTCGATTVVHAQ